MATAADFNILLKARDEASKVIGKVQKEMVGFDSFMDKHAATLNKVAAASAAFVAGIGLMTKGAATQKRTQDQLAASLDNIGVSYASVTGEIESLIAAQQRQTAISDEDQREALRLLIGTLGDYDQALAALPTVLDAAAFAGTGLMETTRTLSKALAGQVNTAESVGLKFDETADFGERLAQTQAVVAGQAEAAATPFAKMQAALSDMGDSIGTIFLPYAEAMALVLQDVAKYVESLDADTVKLVASLVGGAGVAIAIAKVIRSIRQMVTVLKEMAIAESFATAGLTALAGIAGAIVVSKTMDAMLNSTQGAADSMEALGDESQKFADKAPGVAAAIATVAGATYDIEKAAGIAAKAMEPLNAAIDEVLVTSGSVGSEADRVTAVADAFHVLDGIDLGNGLNQAALFDKQLDTTAKIIEQMEPTIREGFERSMLAGVEVLGVGVQDVAAKGGDMVAALTEAYNQADEETQRAFDAITTGMRESLEGLNLDQIFRTAREDMVAEAALLETETQPLVESFVDRTLEKAAELIPAFEQIGAAMPEALKVGFNAMAEVLEGGFNSVFAPWLEGVMQRLNDGVRAISSDGAIPFPDIAGALPEPLALPRLARGTDYFQGGAAWVGEEGPERVFLPRGSRVIPHAESMAMGGGFTNYGTVKVTAAHNAQAFEIMDALVGA